MSDQPEPPSENRSPKSDRPGVWSVLQSIFAAAFGVQSERARERDFTRGRPLPYIVGGLVFTIVLIVGLIVVVQLVIAQAGVQ